MNLSDELTPDTPAQRELAKAIQEQADRLAAWMIQEGRRDHRQRPDPSTAPQYPELVRLIKQLCKLKEQGL